MGGRNDRGHTSSRPGRGALVVLAAVTLLASCSDAGDLLAVVDQFEAPAAWTVAGETIANEPVCLRSDCETAVKRWTASEPPSGEALAEWMRASDWSEVTVDECRPRQDVTGPVPFCRATATSGETVIEVTVSGPVAGPEPYVVVLRVGT